MSGFYPRALQDAAAALIRAAEASDRATNHPHSPTLPCGAQDQAAEAEVACALKLIDEARRS